MPSQLQIPLPTIFEKFTPKTTLSWKADFTESGIEDQVHKDYIYNPRDGWVKKKLHSYFILYNKARPFIADFDAVID